MEFHIKTMDEVLKPCCGNCGAYQELKQYCVVWLQTYKPETPACHDYHNRYEEWKAEKTCETCKHRQYLDCADRNKERPKTKDCWEGTA